MCRCYISLLASALVLQSAFGQEPCSKLFTSCINGNEIEVAAILRSGTNPNCQLGTQTLRWDGAILNDPEWTPLMAACFPRNPAEFPDHETFERRKRSSTDTIRSEKQVSILLMLIANGSDVNARTENGLTALYIAVQSRNFRSAETLVQFGADVNAITTRTIETPAARTPLHEAYWSSELRKLLLKSGGNDLKQDALGWTPKELWYSYQDSSKRIKKERLELRSFDADSVPNPFD